MNKVLYIAVLASVLMVCSCKKSEETTYSSSMTGSVEYMLPDYTVPGQLVYLYARGIVSPEDVTWYWISSSLGISETDTVYSQDITFVIPDSLGKYTIAAYAKKTGYYTSSSTQYTYAIDPVVIGGESIMGILEGDGELIDDRDNQSYFYKKYGRLDWMTQNLRYDESGTSYKHSDSVTTLFGRLYSWDEATLGETGSGLGGGPRGICPEGWSVPTCEDWCDFANAVKPAGVTDSLVFENNWEGLAPDISADLYINETRFWGYCPYNVQTNLHKWNAIPAGRSYSYHTEFDQLKYYGFWWVSALSEDEERGFFRYLYYDIPDFPVSSADRAGIGMSVRCVRLAE